MILWGLSVFLAWVSWARGGKGNLSWLDTRSYEFCLSGNTTALAPKTKIEFCFSLASFVVRISSRPPWRESWARDQKTNARIALVFGSSFKNE
ncbi:hypothetical protein A3H12_04885 [Candidatus Uhrbacteria bacterium RIFCSPLOWO2_12_FULL_47_9]|nr:MAG: hypothetical protein A3H12_04885 [Candidatus Uhrbacteria bacterium RIFCSPLOWO2_12_FULL_47_9]